MVPERRRKVEDVYRAARELDPREVSAFLAGACLGDDELKHEVLSLLAGYSGDGMARGQQADLPDQGTRSKSARQSTPPLTSLNVENTASLSGMLEAGTEGKSGSSRARQETPKSWGTLDLRQLVGSGGFGDVYRAWDPQLAREVALKLLFVRNVNAPPDATLEREGRLLAKLRHPNIVTVYGLANHDGRVGMWMEFVEGRTLDRMVSRQGRFGEREAAAIVIEVCRATAAVHSAGLIHRDIKAQNVIREEGGRIVLTDFGLGQLYVPDAPAAERMTAGIAGTPIYMAPELFEGKPASVKTDIYALGVLLFYLVTAEFPVQCTSLKEIIAAHREGRRRLLADLRPDLPERFTRVADRATEADPAKRFGTAGQFLAELSASQTHDAITGAFGAGDLASVPSVHSGSAVLPTSVVRPSRRSLWRYAISAAAAGALGAGWFGFRHRTAPMVAANSIVVLPFEDLSKQPGDEFLADSLTEELIDTLTGSELRVVARTSAFRLRGTMNEPRQIGERLGVETLLTGTLRRKGDRVRVSVQLVQARTGFQIWAASYEEDANQTLAINEEISQRVVVRLRVNPLPNSGTGPASARRSGNWEAHNAYAQGRFFAARRTLPSLQTAIGFYESALKLDPGYTLAYAGLADAYAYMGVLQSPTPELIGRIKQLAGRALESEDSLAEAHTTLGQVAHLYDWDATASEDHFRLALRRNPRLSEARRHYAGLLIDLRRTREARAELDVAIAVDPLSALLQLSRSLVDYLDGAFDAGQQRLARLMKSDPDIPHAYQLSGLFLLKRERPAEAVDAFRRSVDVSHDNLSFRAYFGYVLAVSGRSREARAILHRIQEESKSTRVDPVDFATLYAGLGENAAALDWLDKAVVAHSPNLVQLLIRPTWDRLRKEPGFAGIVRRVTLFRNAQAKTTSRTIIAHSGRPPVYL